ncbi:MAG TPA: hypothetical protein VGQ62_13945, partial [Chloroflexota bacterium]|nr:hypothetical protein [Chloroflexota bacterium]
MIPSPFKYLRALAPLTAAAALSLSGTPAMAQTLPGACSTIRFDVGNPTPGSRVEIGALVVSGIAQDRAATQGLGISSVDFFLDNRDTGGMNLGSVVPGAAPGPAGYGSFKATLTIPNLTGGHDFFAYAHSAVSNADVIVSLPIAVGTDPSKI